MAKKTQEQLNKTKRRFESAQIILFCLLLGAGGVLGALWMLRPQVSQTEKRELTQFPEFTVAGFLEGTYCGQISTWYADTYPLRDVWLHVDQAVEGLYGIRSSQILGGGGKTADEIPQTYPESSEENQEESREASKADSSAEEMPGNDSLPMSENSQQQASSAPEKPVIPDDPTQIQQAVQDQIQDGLYINADAAYSRYFFSLEEADRYIAMVNRVAGELAGRTEVYSMIIPDSTQIMLDPETVEQLGGSSEQQAIRYYYARMDEAVHTVSTFDTLYGHRDEYIYFRTDHHWTQLGAYYVYRNFAEEKGWTPHSLSLFEKADFGEFLGSFYSVCGSEAMKKNPDQMEAYLPQGTNEMVFYTPENEKIEWNVVRDVSDWSEDSKYSCFIGGDNPLSMIENPQITDGSSCLLVKESFGNALAPFLVDHYQFVYIIDYRYYTDNIMDFIESKPVDDLILANNVAIIGSEYVTDRLNAMFS